MRKRNGKQLLKLYIQPEVIEYLQAIAERNNLAVSDLVKRSIGNEFNQCKLFLHHIFKQLNLDVKLNVCPTCGTHKQRENDIESIKEN